MKLNLAVTFAAVAVLFTVQASPTARQAAVADAEAGATLTGRRYCCKYATSGQWCGNTGCCLWSDYCVTYGSPAQCGYAGCCIKYAC